MMTTFISANDNISYGSAALYALIGFLIVVAVLAVLVGIFYLSGAIFKSKLLNRERKNKNKNNEPSVSTDEVADDDGEIVAAITAAITVMLAEDDDVKPNFVIRRVTRKK